MGAPGIAGPFAAYPVIVTKGMQELGLMKKKEEKGNKKKRT